MSKSDQLFLLADHIKLLLLERRRAQSLDLDADANEGHLMRSLDQFRTGLASLEDEQVLLEQGSDKNAAIATAESVSQLRQQLGDLTTQFHGFSDPSTNATIQRPNATDFAEDFAHTGSLSSLKGKTKLVRFSDTPSASSDDLFAAYRDEPSTDIDQSHPHTQEMSNQGLHHYHSQILEEQDQQLDRLGESISRQRELSMQIGDELDSHVTLLDGVDDVLDRHQNRLDHARKVLGRVARGASENKQVTAIVILIVILILLIAILK